MRSELEAELDQPCCKGKQIVVLTPKAGDGGLAPVFEELAYLLADKYQVRISLHWLAKAYVKAPILA